MSKKGTPHKNQLNRIKRIEGQVRGIKKMVEEERYCIELINQIKAVKSALGSVEVNVLEEHLNHCVNHALNSNEPDKVHEIISEIKSILKSSIK